MITLAHLQQDAIHLLREVSDSARLDAELLIAHALAIPRTRFITEPDTPIDNAQLASVQQYLQQRRRGYPVAYLLGYKHFWDVELSVTEATLIPRPETELLVETALTLFPVDQPIDMADLGTGSGAIAIAMAKARPAWSLLATDRYSAALQIAQQNAAKYQLANIRFLQSNWFESISATQGFDLLISNPPYIREDDPHLQQGDVQYEPRTALHSGHDGLDDIRRLIADAPRYLKNSGWLLLEHGYDQADAISALFAKHGYIQITQKQDLAGHTRMTMGMKADG